MDTTRTLCHRIRARPAVEALGRGTRGRGRAERGTERGRAAGGTVDGIGRVSLGADGADAGLAGSGGVETGVEDTAADDGAEPHRRGLRRGGDPEAGILETAGAGSGAL